MRLSIHDNSTLALILFAALALGAASYDVSGAAFDELAMANLEAAGGSVSTWGGSFRSIA